MNREIIISVYLPAAYQTFELSVPLSITAQELVTTVSHMLEPLADGLYRTGEHPVFIEKNSRRILSGNTPLDTLGIGSGAEFILI